MTSVVAAPTPRDSTMTEADPWERIQAALNGQQAITPRWICQVCTTLVPVTGAAIVETIDVNQRHLVYATDEVAARLETLQFSLGEGPCVHAVSTGGPVQVSDLHQSVHLHWPVFAEAASHTPARALYCLPLHIGAIDVGVLGLYRDRPGLLTNAELASALLCAHVAFWTLLAMRLDRNPDLATAQTSVLDPAQPEIHQATNMLMTQLAISAEAALATLRAHAYAHTQPLEEVAHQVVTGRLHLPLDEQ